MCAFALPGRWVRRNGWRTRTVCPNRSGLCFSCDLLKPPKKRNSEGYYSWGFCSDPSSGSCYSSIGNQSETIAQWTCHGGDFCSSFRFTGLCVQLNKFHTTHKTTSSVLRFSILGTVSIFLFSWYSFVYVYIMYYVWYINLYWCRKLAYKLIENISNNIWENIILLVIIFAIIYLYNCMYLRYNYILKIGVLCSYCFNAI